MILFFQNQTTHSTYLHIGTCYKNNIKQHKLHFCFENMEFKPQQDMNLRVHYLNFIFKINQFTIG